MKNPFTNYAAILFVVAFVLFSCSESEDPISTGGQLSISSISPDNGLPGALVTIYGSGFDTIPGGNMVKFNQIDATVVVASDTILVTEVPLDAGTGAVTVQVGEAVATGPVFNYIDEPPVNASYYVKFKADGIWKLVESSNPGFQSCGNCACCQISPFGSDLEAFLSVCNENNDYVSVADITSWDKQKIDVESSTFPKSDFGYSEAELNYHTDFASDNSDSWIQISSVEADGDLYGKQAFKVTGTFQCKVADLEEMIDVEITEGTFVVRWTENF